MEEPSPGTLHGLTHSETEGNRLLSLYFPRYKGLCIRLVCREDCWPRTHLETATRTRAYDCGGDSCPGIRARPAWPTLLIPLNCHANVCLPSEGRSYCSGYAFTPISGWKENSLVKLSVSTSRASKVTDHWTCHRIPWSAQDWGRRLIAAVTDISDAPQITAQLDRPPSGLTFQVQILQHMNVSSSCLIFPSVLKRPSTTSLGHPQPHSDPFLINKCCQEKNTSKWSQQLLLSNTITDGVWKDCGGNDPWLNTVLTKLPINEAINEGSRGGIMLISQGSVSRVVLEMIHLAKDGHINISTAGKQIYGRWLIKFPHCQYTRK